MQHQAVKVRLYPTIEQQTIRASALWLFSLVVELRTQYVY